MRTVVFLLVLLAITGCGAQSMAPHDSLDAFTAHLDRRIPRLIDQHDVPGVSIALIRDGQLAWSGAYGYADVERGRLMTVDAVCRAESISKSVTAWGVMTLVERGLIDLDAPVQQYLGAWRLPQSDYAGHEVTVRRLLSHNAGMPLGPIGEEYAPQSEMPSLQDYLAREAQLVRQPGSGFSYSNPGYDVLELLIQNVTGRAFADYMSQEVLIPLGMNNASFTWHERFGPTIPTGYDLQGNPVSPYIYAVKASGGLFATVEDIAHFVSAGMTSLPQDAHALIGDDGARMLYTPEVPIPGVFGLVADAYGFGHFLETLPDGRRAVWHGGQGHGWMTHFHAIPQSGDGIVILTNSQRSWPFIAQVLNDWARWRGAGSVKFGRMAHATTALQLLAALVALLALWQFVRLLRGLRGGHRAFAPLSTQSPKARILQAALGMAVIVALTWSATRPYLMVSSVFPDAAGHAGLSILMLSGVAVVSALCPRRS